MVTQFTTTTTARRSEDKCLSGQKARTHIPQGGRGYKGGMEKKRERRSDMGREGGGDRYFSETINSRYLREVDTVTFTQTHTFKRTFRGHREPANGIHYAKCHGLLPCQK